ncbi:MAG: hypothetical protein V2I33_20385 [Kangiellaceae bacterium]|nr:hypothetical protein [Kangiellaceae bacterium]
MAKAMIEPSQCLLRGWPFKQLDRPKEITLEVNQLELLSGKIRVWNDDEARYGDPFDWAAEIYWIDKTSVEICAYVLPVSPSAYRAAYRECARWGIERIKKTIYHNGADEPPKVQWIDIKPSKVQQYYERDEGPTNSE